jgi:LmbE family N-acetylglucosaminyl deacetylase
MSRSPDRILDRILVVSPHLDDAVLSCGALLASCAGAVVVTVFAGAAPDDQPLTEWDRKAGFASSREAVAARREEDARALALLDAKPVWLDFLDAQYGWSPKVAEVTAALAAELDRHRPDCVVAPLGLFHGDHVLVHRAVLALRERVAAAGEQASRHIGTAAEARAPPVWLAYEDVPYRQGFSRMQRRLCELLATGVAATPYAPVATAESDARKQASLACYPSQLRALGADGRPGCGDAQCAERYWILEALDPVER